MKYFKQEDFNKCMEFLAGKPETVETQQELYKFMHEECHMRYILNDVLVKDMKVYSKVYETRMKLDTANWCTTMSDGSQIVWNRKYQEFYMLDAVGMDRCDCLNYMSMFPELEDIDKWLLENWSDWRFVEMQKQLIAIWCGRYNQFFHNFWRCQHG